MLAEWLAALEGWSVAEALRASFYLYPLVNAAHIFGIALLVGSILPVDLRLLGAFRHIPIAGFVPLMTGFSAAGLAIAIVAGFLLFSVKPQEYADNPAFLTKIALVALGTFNALALRWTPPGGPHARDLASAPSCAPRRCCRSLPGQRRCWPAGGSAFSEVAG